MPKNKRFLVTAAVLLLSFLLPDVASATQLTQASVRLDRLGISDATSLLVTFKLNTTPTSVSSIKVTLPTGFTVTTGTPVVGNAFPLTPAGITLPPGVTAGTTTATVTSGSKTIVLAGLTSASLTSSTLYGFTIPTTTSVTNPSTTGQYNITVESDNSGGTTIDSTTTPIFITTATGADQVTVNASVAPNFSFSLSANSDTIPKLDPSAIQTSAGVNMIVGTNSPLGYTAYVKSANDALNSPTAGAAGTIPTGTFDGTPDTITAGTTKYGLVPSTGTACSSCTGVPVYNGEYAVADGTHVGSFAPSSAFAAFVSHASYTNADTIDLQERAAVSTTIPYASDYTDTLTIVAAGNF